MKAARGPGWVPATRATRDLEDHERTEDRGNLLSVSALRYKAASRITVSYSIVKERNWLAKPRAQGRYVLQGAPLWPRLPGGGHPARPHSMCTVCRVCGAKPPPGSRFPRVPCQGPGFFRGPLGPLGLPAGAGTPLFQDLSEGAHWLVLAILLVFPGT